MISDTVRADGVPIIAADEPGVSENVTSIAAAPVESIAGAVVILAKPALFALAASSAISLILSSVNIVMPVISSA
jgi:hypothetical protein